jgi:hypothetical protein
MYSIDCNDNDNNNDKIVMMMMIMLDCNDNDYNDDDDDDDNDNNNNSSIQCFTPHSDCLPLLFCKYKRRLYFLSNILLLLNSYNNNFEQIHQKTGLKRINFFRQILFLIFPLIIKF